MVTYYIDRCCLYGREMVSFHIKAGLNYVKRSVESFGQPVGDVDSVVGDEDDVDDGANDKQQSTHVT